jgi:hypothetical protein
MFDKAPRPDTKGVDAPLRSRHHRTVRWLALVTAQAEGRKVTPGEAPAKQVRPFSGGGEASA